MLTKDTYEAMIANSSHTKPFILTTTAEPPGAYMVCVPRIAANGDRSYEVENRFAKPLPRAYHATTLLGLCAQVERLVEAKAVVPENVAVFVSRREVRAVLGESERRECITFSPTLSAPLRLIAASVPGKEEERDHDDGHDSHLLGLSQKALIHILRREFDGLVDPPAFLPLVRQLKFSSRTQGEGSVLGVGRESMGKSIEASIAGLESGHDLPESIRLRGRVFENVSEAIPGGEFDLACVLDADLGEQTFSLLPTALALEDALQAAELGMGDFVKGNTPAGVMVMPQSEFTSKV